MARIDIKSAGATLNDGVLQLQGGVAMSTTLTAVADQNDTTSPLKLSTTAVQVVSPFRITTDDPSDMYLDCEDGSANNRFNITRNTASQQVNLNFASNPVGSTSIVGGIRTFVDGVNLSEVMAFREDGQTFVTGNTTIGNGTTAIASRLAIKGSGSTSATTSLLVQNSSAVNSLMLKDNGDLTTYGTINIRSQVGDNGGNISTSATQNLILSSSAYGTGSAVNINTNGVIIQRVGTNSNADISSVLDVRSTTQGFLPPRMTDAQIRAIATPAEGLIAYNTDISHLCCYQAGAWVKLSHSPM